MRNVRLILVLFLLIYSCAHAQEYTPTYIQKKELQEDLIFLKENVTKIHPKFIEDDFCKKWDEQYSTIFSTIPDSVSFNDSYVMFSSLLAILEDGHSNFSFPYSERKKYMEKNGTTMPFTVRIKNNKIYIDQYFDEADWADVIGSEIQSINNISYEKILKDLQVFYGSKKASITENNIERYFGAYFWTVYGSFPEYDIEILNDNKSVTLQLQPVTNNEYFVLKKRLYPEQIKKQYELLFFNNANLAYLRIKSFADKTTLSEYLKNAFDSISINKCKNLIIDLRDNFGGTSGCVDTLLSYLTNKRYKQYKSIGLRVSEPIKDKHKQRDTVLYAKIENKRNNQLFYYPERMLRKQPVNRTNLFKGNISVIINDKTYSAASTFAGVIKEYNLGKIVGQTETGGTIEYYGDFLLFELPNTQMSFCVSSKIFKQCGGNDMNKGVFPDVIIDNDDCDILQIEQELTNAR